MRLAPASGSLWSPLSLSILWWKSEQMAASSMEKFNTVQAHRAGAFGLAWSWKKVSAENGFPVSEGWSSRCPLNPARLRPAHACQKLFRGEPSGRPSEELDHAAASPPSNA